MVTPGFPDWAGGFAHQLRKLRSTAAPTLHQFELLFAAWIPHWRLAQQDEGNHSRDRRWNLRLVFWTFLWQVAQAGSSCREAIRQAQALCKNAGRPVPPAPDSPYCQARGGLPLERLQEIHDGLCAEAQKGLAFKDSGADITSWWPTVPPSAPRIPRPIRGLSHNRKCRSPGAASRLFA